MDMNNERVKQLKDALDAGILTQSEYDKKILELNESILNQSNNKDETDATKTENDNTTKNENTSKFSVKKLLIILAIIILFAGVIFIFIYQPQEKYEWPSSGLATLLPEPNGKIDSLGDYDEYLDADIIIESKEDYDNYLSECQSLGFDIVNNAGSDDYDYLDDSYVAFNDDGNKLNLGYNDSDEQELCIRVDRAIENNNITWPTSGIGKMIPKPESSEGEVRIESELYFDVYVTGITKDQYAKYVSDVLNSGFNKDYNKEEFKFNAHHKKSDEISIEIEYYGNNIIYISGKDFREDSEDLVSSDTNTTEESYLLGEWSVSDSNGNGSAVFNEDNTATLSILNDTWTGTWSFIEEDSDSGAYMYMFYFDDGGTSGILLNPEKRDTFAFVSDEGKTLLFER